MAMATKQRRMNVVFRLQVLVLMAVMSAAGTAEATQNYSAHFCQPHQNGGVPSVELTYENQGSILAVKEVTVSCPIRFDGGLTGRLNALLFYSTTGVTAVAPIACRFWKTSFFENSQPGPGQPATARSRLDLDTDYGPSNTMAGHIECRLKPGASAQRRSEDSPHQPPGIAGTEEA